MLNITTNQTLRHLDDTATSLWSDRSAPGGRQMNQHQPVISLNEIIQRSSPTTPYLCLPILSVFRHGPSSRGWYAYFIHRFGVGLEIKLAGGGLWSSLLGPSMGNTLTEEIKSLLTFCGILLGPSKATSCVIIQTECNILQRRASLVVFYFNVQRSK